MNKLICLSLILVILFSFAFCEEVKKGSKKGFAKKENSKNDDFTPVLKNSDFRPEEKHEYGYHPKEAHRPERPEEGYEQLAYHQKEAHHPERPEESHEQLAYHQKEAHHPEESHKQPVYHQKEAHHPEAPAGPAPVPERLLKGPRFFRLCTYTTPTCTFTGVPSCYLIENGQCTVLPTGHSIIVYAIGESVTALFSYDSMTCSSTGHDLIIVPQQFENCFSFSKFGLYHKFLPLEGVSLA